MTRLIDADKLRAEYQAILDRGDMFCEYDIIGMVDNAPTVEERPKGEWIYKEFDAESGISRSYWCSNCGEPKSQWCDDFCQRCGADMREADNDKN